MIKFGDVFEHKSQYYVYLALDPEMNLIYAAKILSLGDTSKIVRLNNTRGQTAGDANSIFCYVLLKTDSLKDRAAHFHNTGKEDLTINPIYPLDETDLKSIKNEIETSPAIPQILKELTSGINFS